MNTIDYKSNNLQVINRNNYSSFNCHFLVKKNLSLDIILENKDQLFSLNNPDINIFHRGSLEKPKIKLSFMENNSFTIDNQLNYNFNLNIPIFNFLYAELYGLSQKETIENVALTNNLTFQSDIQRTLYGISLKYNLYDFIINFGINIKELTSEPASNDRTISLVLKTDDNYSMDINLGYNFNESSLNLGYSFENLSLNNNRIMGLSGESLFFYMKSNSLYNLNDFNLSYKWKENSINFAHKIFQVNSTEGFLETKPFIFGPLAFRKYEFTTNPFNIYNTQISFIKRLQSNLGETLFNISLSRFYSLDQISHTHNYTEKIWNFLGYTIIGGIENTSAVLEYDHINLINLNMQHQISIKDINVKFGINQIIPFFDSFFQKSNNIKSNTSNNDANHANGGTTLFLNISYFL